MAYIDKIRVGGTDYDLQDSQLKNAFQTNLYENISPYPYYDGESKTTNGITFIVQDDGSIKASGTATADAYFYIINANQSKKLPVGTYVLSGNPDGYGDNTYVFCGVANPSGSGDILSLQNKTIPVSASVNAEGVVRYFIVVRNGKTVSNIVFKPMLQRGSIATNYISPHNPHKDHLLNNSLTRVNDYNGLLASTEDIVFVVHNDGPYGDGGDCIFEATDETERTILRNNGTYVRPIIGQGDLNPTSIEIPAIIDHISGYIGNSSLNYGNDNTLFNGTCSGGEIDCSSFVQAFLMGITYENSRYVLGSDSSNVYGTAYGANLPSTRMNTGNLASWFAQHKQLYEIPKSDGTWSVERKLAQILKPGDILFFKDPDPSESVKLYKIDHVVIVLASLYPRYNYVIIAQVGGSPGENSSKMPSNTTGNIARIDLGACRDRLAAFARPVYSDLFKTRQDGNELLKLFGGDYYFGTAFIPGGMIHAQGHRAYTTSSYSADFTMYPVIPGKKIYNINNDSINLYVTFYDVDKKLVRNASTVSAIGPGSSVTIGESECYAAFYVNTTNLQAANRVKVKME